METFRKEVMCKKFKYWDHLQEHDEMDAKYGVDCNNMTVKDHLLLHLEYLFFKGEVTEEQYLYYKEEE